MPSFGGDVAGLTFAGRRRGPAEQTVVIPSIWNWLSRIAGLRQHPLMLNGDRIMSTPRRTLAPLLVAAALGVTACGESDAENVQDQGEKLQQQAQDSAKEVQDGSKSVDDAAKDIQAEAEKTSEDANQAANDAIDQLKGEVPDDVQEQLDQAQQQLQDAAP